MNEPDEVVSEEVDDETVVLDTATGALHLLDRAATEMWRRLDGPDIERRRFLGGAAGVGAVAAAFPVIRTVVPAAAGSPPPTTTTSSTSSTSSTTSTTVSTGLTGAATATNAPSATATPSATNPLPTTATPSATSSPTDVLGTTVERDPAGNAAGGDPAAGDPSGIGGLLPRTGAELAAVAGFGLGALAAGEALRRASRDAEDSPDAKPGTAGQDP